MTHKWQIKMNYSQQNTSHIIKICVKCGVINSHYNLAKQEDPHYIDIEKYYLNQGDDSDDLKKLSCNEIVLKNIL